MSWRKSILSDTNGCVEVWRKSARSGSNGCVEVAGLPDGWVAVRDSKHPDGPVLRFTPVEWAAFLAGVRNGEFD
jgi:hypothetical protein